MVRPAVFDNRDSTLNVDKTYLHRFEELEWIQRVVTAIKTFNEAGFLSSNQAGVARGLYSEADIEQLHARVDPLCRLSARIDAYYCCTHHPEFGDHTIPRRPFI